jgi:hypothetical protein
LRDEKSLIRKWQGYAQRRLPDAVDTAFGITVNNHTAAKQDGDSDRINFDRKRIQRDDLDDFFKNLKTFVEAENREYLIGPTFVMDEDAQGKDWDNVVILTAAPQGTAQNINGNMFAMVAESESLTLTGHLSDLRMSISPTEMPESMSNEAKAVLTHEMCHSFGLGDEYAKSPPKRFSKMTVAEAAEWPFARFESQASTLDRYSNLQAREDLLNDPTDDDSGIDALKIKWRYHRIQKCAVVSTINVNQNTVTLKLQGNQTAQFAVGNPVFLRKRQRKENVYLLVSSSDATPFLEHTIIHPETIPSRYLGRVKIKSIDTADDLVTITSDGKTDSLKVKLESGKSADLKVRQTVFIETQSTNPVHTIFRTDVNDFTRAVSPQLSVTNVDLTTQTLTLAIPAQETLIDYLQTLDAKEVMIVYVPVELPADQRSANYPYAELIAKPVLSHLQENPYPFNANKQHQEAIRDNATTLIPSQLVPCCSRREKEIIGLYSGGKKYHGDIYHPSAKCMMRHEFVDKKYTELCAVCRYTLVNMIDPTQFAAFDKDYMSRKIYP